MVHPENGCSDAVSTQIVVLGQPEASFILTPDVVFDAPYVTNVIDMNQSPAGTTETWVLLGTMGVALWSLLETCSTTVC